MQFQELNLIKPLLAAVGGIGGALGIYLLLASRLGESKQLTLCAIGLAMLAYFTFILCLRAVTEKDVQMLPGGEKLAGILKRLKLLK